MKLMARLIKEIPYRYRGKYRIVKEPRFIDLLQLRHDLEREERNMLLLRHPYLTAAQSRGHMKDLRNVDMIEVFKAQKTDKFTKRITIEDRLSHLKVGERWD